MGRSAGGAGWSYRDLLPHFVKQEDNDHLAGPITESAAPEGLAPRPALPDEPCLRAGPAGEGDCLQPGLQRSPAGRRRFHAAHHRPGRPPTVQRVDAFLRPVLSDLRLTVETGTTAMRIRIEHGQAVGVDFTSPGGAGTAYADTEVILAAGTYASPTILMLSGLGPAQELARLGVRVEADLPPRRQNSRISPSPASPEPPGHSAICQDRGLAMLAHGLQYVSSGPGRDDDVEACAFIDPDGGERPTLQLYCVPTIYLDRDVSGVEPTHGVTPNLPSETEGARLGPPGLGGPLGPAPGRCAVLRPSGRSCPDHRRAALRPRGPRDVPAQGSRRPGTLSGADTVSDEDLAAHCRRTVKTNYHSVGTCRMGRDGDPDAVDAADLKVRGVEGARDRCVDHADDPERKHQRTGACDRRQGRRDHRARREARAAPAPVC